MSLDDHLHGQLRSRHEGDLLSVLLMCWGGAWKFTRGNLEMYIGDVRTCNKGFGSFTYLSPCLQTPQYPNPDLANSGEEAAILVYLSAFP